ncbi:MAG: hypothetical protein CVT86_07655 [Alphaproteobacteria bacterium HGW-Alphaproteobacteria-8]|nr:MAG: hypothetical protein CVT86_07655 [Alphaproteobacteria bacterium HGW-Alphaproteobacteria-8]
MTRYLLLQNAPIGLDIPLIKNIRRIDQALLEAVKEALIQALAHLTPDGFRQFDVFAKHGVVKVSVFRDGRVYGFVHVAEQCIDIGLDKMLRSNGGFTQQPFKHSAVYFDSRRTGRVR